MNVEFYSRVKRVLIFVFFLGLGVCGLVAGALYTIGQQCFPEEPDILHTGYQIWSNPGARAFANKDALNILCLGLDYNQTNKGIRFTKWVRTDSIFVLHAEKNAQHLNILSIPRDMRVEIAGYGYDKINAAYATSERGNKALTKDTVERLLGVPIDHIIVIREYAAQRMVDALGGIDIDVEKDMDYDDNWGDLHIHLKKGPQHLNGRQAVGYIRFRHDDEGDRGRIRRQQQLMGALVGQMKRVQNFSHLRQLVQVIRENVDTTLDFADMADIAICYQHFNRSQIMSAKLDGSDAYYGGVSYIEPDAQQNRKLVSRLLMGNYAAAPEDVRLEILNASKMAGAAARLAEILHSRGYQIVHVGSADPLPESHLVTHGGDQQVAMSLRSLLGGELNVKQGTHGDADVTIVLGKDWPARTVLSL